MLSDVPPNVSVAGVPSRVLGENSSQDSPSQEMNHTIISLLYESGGGI